MAEGWRGGGTAREAGGREGRGGSDEGGKDEEVETRMEGRECRDE